MNWFKRLSRDFGYLCRHDPPGRTAGEDMQQAWDEIFDVVKPPGGSRER